MPTDERNPEDERAALNGAGSRNEASADAFDAQEALEGPSLIRQIRELAQALQGTGVGELDLTDEDTRIYIKRQLEPTVIAPRASGRPAAREEYAPAEAPAPPDPGIAIVAPLTGVFYTASSPATPNFTSVGETVQVGQTVCIVEAMKVFNEIKAEVGGVVAAIVAQNGQLVQKGEALIRLKSI